VCAYACVYARVCDRESVSMRVCEGGCVCVEMCFNLYVQQVRIGGIKLLTVITYITHITSAHRAHHITQHHINKHLPLSFQ